MIMEVGWVTCAWRPSPWGCRVQIIRMLAHAGSGHPGGSLSVIDLLVAIAFGRFAPRSLQVYDA